MKDEELFKAWKSEQYKDQSTEEKMEFVEHLHTFPKYFEKTFLAGLKAGRPQWHYVKDGDLPKHNHEVLCLMWSVTKEIGYYENEVWHFENFEADYEDVDYWQEIVPPKESE